MCVVYREKKSSTFSNNYDLDKFFKMFQRILFILLYRPSVTVLNKLISVISGLNHFASYNSLYPNSVSASRSGKWTINRQFW